MSTEETKTSAADGQSELKRLVSLMTPDLDIYTVVVMARRDLQDGLYESAITRLKIDADKLRTHSRELYDLITAN